MVSITRNLLKLRPLLRNSRESVPPVSSSPHHKRRRQQRSSSSDSSSSTSSTERQPSTPTMSSTSSAQARLGQASAHLTGSSGAPGPLLAGQVALITGAAQGIGRSTAILFASHGAKVFVSDLDGAKLQVVVDEITQSGAEAKAFVGDVTKKNFGDEIVNACVDAFGGIDHLVMNAGYTYDGMAHTTTDEKFEAMLLVHNIAPFRIIRASAPYMRKKDGSSHRSIVTVSSTSGTGGNIGQINYATAKSGVLGMTKTLAKEWGPFGVRVNCVAFGFIETRLTAAKESGAFIEVDGKQIALGIPGAKPPQGQGASKEQEDNAVKRVKDIPLGRAGTADEAAKAIFFLASPLASYVSGHTLMVTGGRGI